MLRTAALGCLGIWAAVGLLFMISRFSPFDIRGIPGIGTIALVTLGVAVVAPVLAMVLAAAALIRKPRTLFSWLTLGCAAAIVLGQAAVFMSAMWM